MSCQKKALGTGSASHLGQDVKQLQQLARQSSRSPLETRIGQNVNAFPLTPPRLPCHLTSLTTLKTTRHRVVAGALLYTLLLGSSPLTLPFTRLQHTSPAPPSHARPHHHQPVLPGEAGSRLLATIISRHAPRPQASWCPPPPKGRAADGANTGPAPRAAPVAEAHQRGAAAQQQAALRGH